MPMVTTAWPLLLMMLLIFMETSLTGALVELSRPQFPGGAQFRDHLQSAAHRLFALFGPDLQTFGDDDLQIGDAEKAEDAAQITFHMFEGGRRHARAIKTAARNRDDHALVARQTFGAVGGVAEGLAGDRDAVDPGLELAGDAKIVHGRADDDDV